MFPKAFRPGVTLDRGGNDSCSLITRILIGDVAAAFSRADAAAAGVHTGTPAVVAAHAVSVAAARATAADSAATVPTSYAGSGAWTANTTWDSHTLSESDPPVSSAKRRKR